LGIGYWVLGYWVLVNDSECRVLGKEKNHCDIPIESNSIMEELDARNTALGIGLKGFFYKIFF